MAEGWTHSLLHQDTVIELAEAENVLGRSRHCQVTVADPSVSRKHALLVPGPGHVVVRDLGSSNGTFINDRKVVSEDVVEDGDTLRVGDAILNVRIVGPRSEEQPPAIAPGAAAETVRLPIAPPPGGPTAIQPPGEATAFLQAESMKLAAQAYDEEAEADSEAEAGSPFGEPRTETVPPAAAPPPQVPPVQAPPTLGAETRRLDTVQPPPEAPPVAAPTPPGGAETRRLDTVQPPPGPPPVQTPPPFGAETRRLDTVQPPPDPPPVQAPPPVGAQTQRLETVQLPPEAPPAQAPPPQAPPTQAPPEPSTPPFERPSAETPLHTQRIPIPQPPAPEPPAPPAPAPAEPPAAEASDSAPVQAYGDGPTSLQIPGPPDTPDIDVSSEQSIIGMPAIHLPMPDVEGEAPEVPDIDLSSEQSIIGMPAIRLPMPDVEGEAPEVPDIDVSSEQSIIGTAIPLPVAGDPGFATPPPSPPRPPEPSQPSPGAGQPDESQDLDSVPDFGTDDDFPSFELDATPDFGFEPDSEPPFELDEPPSFETDEPPAAPASFADPPRSVSTVPLDDDEDIRSLVQPLSEGPEDLTGFSLDLDASGVGGAPAVADVPPPPKSFADPPPSAESSPPQSPPAGAPSAAGPSEPRFDVPIPPATPPPKGPNDPPAPNFDTPPSGDFAVTEFEPPDFDPPDFEPPGFDGSDLEPAELVDPMAIPDTAFDQPTPAAAPPPSTDDLDFPMRQPTSDLLPTLDDLTASVAPPEARPPQPVSDSSSGAFAHVTTTTSTSTVDPQLAGFWIRAAAALLDAILVASLTAGAVMLTQNQLVGAAVNGACALAIYLGWAFAGRSPGKIALGLVIEDVDGNARIGLLRAAIRAAGTLLSCLTLGIGFLMVLFRDDRRALHDKIAGTWVRRG